MFTKITWNFLFTILFLTNVNAMASVNAMEKADLFTENCGEYPSDIKSFRPLSDMISGSAQNNPLRIAENCLLQVMDKNLKPICDEEKILKGELRKGNYNTEDLKEINEYLTQLVKVKQEYADILYEVANEADKMLKALQDGTTTDVATTDVATTDVATTDDATTDDATTDDATTDDATTDAILSVVYDMSIKGIREGYRDIVAIKALKLCGSTLERNAEEGV